MKKISISVIWLAAAMLFLSSLSVYAMDRYVDAGNSGYADGYGWGTAYPDLQTAFLGVSPGDVVRVATGIYVPGTSRTDSFVVPDGVKVYGGYPSGGAGIRDWQDWGNAIAVESVGNAYVTGKTDSTYFPSISFPHDVTTYSSDVFVYKDVDGEDLAEFAARLQAGSLSADTVVSFAAVYGH